MQADQKIVHWATLLGIFRWICFVHHLCRLEAMASSSPPPRMVMMPAIGSQWCEEINRNWGCFEEEKRQSTHVCTNLVFVLKQVAPGLKSDFSSPTVRKMLFPENEGRGWTSYGTQ
jgi:hypothetical protein